MPSPSTVTAATPELAAGSPAVVEVDRLNQRAHALRHQDAGAALLLVRQARALAEQTGYTRGQAYALLREALLRHMLGEAETQYTGLLAQSLVLMRQAGDIAGEAEAVNVFGHVHTRRGDHGQAEAQHRIALALRRALGDAAGIAVSLNNLGIALREQGRPAEALEALLLSLETARTLAPPAPWRPAAYAQLNIGTTLAELGDAAAAIERFDEVIRLAHTPGVAEVDHGIECSARIGIGEAQLALGRHEAALAQLHSAWQMAERTGNAGDLARALLALGAVHQSLSAFATAEERLQGALAIAERSGEPGLAAEVLRLLGRNELLQGRPRAALPLLDRALHTALTRGAPRVAAQMHELLAQAHEAAGDLPEALANLREFQRVREQLAGQVTLRRVHALLWQQQLAGLEREADSQRHAAEEQRHLAESLAQALEVARQAEQEKAALLAEVAAQAQALQQLAREDGLTQVANRRWFDTQWLRELERARRHAHPVAVAMVDVDDFKRINDRFGHGMGDEVLKRVAQVLRENCRSNDLVARYGGEEFVLMFVETGIEGARRTCEKLRERVQAVAWDAVHEGLPPVTVSIGVACWTPERQPMNVLGEADAQLYRAKDQGKNRVCWHAVAA